MRASVLLFSLLPSAFAYQASFSEHCTDIALSAQGILTATCEDRQQKPQAAALDVNTVLGVNKSPKISFDWATPVGPT